MRCGGRAPLLAAVGYPHILFFFVRFSSLRYCNGELNHSPYFRTHCSLCSMSRLISMTSASKTCQCASRLLKTFTRSDLASARAHDVHAGIAGERAGQVDPGTWLSVPSMDETTFNWALDKV